MKFIVLEISFCLCPLFFHRNTELKLEKCCRTLTSGDGSMSASLAGLTREVVLRGGNATTAIFGIMGRTRELELTYLGSRVLGSRAALQ